MKYFLYKEGEGLDYTNPSLFHFDFVKDIAALDKEMMGLYWSNEQWMDSLCHDEHFHLIYCPDKALLAFHLNPQDSVTHLYKIAVSESLKGSGFSKKMFSKFVEMISKETLSQQEIYLEVESKNLRAIGFYERLGFKKIHQKKSFYSNGDDALIMTLSLLS